MSRSYRFDRYVADLEAVRERVGAEQVHLFGHSWGGVLAMRYATAHPERVRSIALMGSGTPSLAATAKHRDTLWRAVRAKIARKGIEIWPRRLNGLSVFAQGCQHRRQHRSR